jgi:hypothetical protein
MEDVVNTFAGRLYAGDVLKVHLLKVDSVANICEVVEVSCREIVDAADVVSLIQESMGQR